MLTAIADSVIRAYVKIHMSLLYLEDILALMYKFRAIVHIIFINHMRPYLKHEVRVSILCNFFAATQEEE